MIATNYRRTAGFGALQPVADDAAYERRCPIPAVRNIRPDRLSWVIPDLQA